MSNQVKIKREANSTSKPIRKIARLSGGDKKCHSDKNCHSLEFSTTYRLEDGWKLTKKVTFVLWSDKL
jgi:hypothetical protein